MLSQFCKHQKRLLYCLLIQISQLPSYKSLISAAAIDVLLLDKILVISKQMFATTNFTVLAN